MNQRIVRLLAGSVLAVAVSAAWAADNDGGVLHFDISRFDVSGNTLLPQQLIDQAVAPFTGKQRDFGDVQRALEAVEAVYHQRGYGVVTVELPEQELQSGVVQLKVIQTKIGRVLVKGNTHFSEANIRASVPELQEGRTPNLNLVSTSLKLANENPSKKVTLKLASGEQDDEVDATLNVDDQSVWKGMLNADNTGTASTMSPACNTPPPAKTPAASRSTAPATTSRCTRWTTRSTSTAAIRTSIPAPSPPACSTWPSAARARSTAGATTTTWPSAAITNPRSSTASTTRPSRTMSSCSAKSWATTSPSIRSASPTSACWACRVARPAARSRWCTTSPAAATAARTISRARAPARRPTTRCCAWPPAIRTL